MAVLMLATLLLGCDAVASKQFTTKTIQQSTPMPDASNVITIVLNPDTDLPTGSTVKIQWLTGSQIGDRSALSISSTNNKLGKLDPYL